MELRSLIYLIAIYFLLNNFAAAQFVDDFTESNTLDGNQSNGWRTLTGSGNIKISLQHKKPDYAKMSIDASEDQMNVWWGIIKRNVAGYLDVEKLSQDDYELRVETRIKVSHAPRRINLHFNTQRTTDFHSHLMEYDIADTTNWHTLSMTTKDFEAVAGDDINVQLAMMDWGINRYSVLLDYIKVDVVNVNEIGEDIGNPQKYHPVIPNIDSYSYSLVPVQNAVVSEVYRNHNFMDWSSIKDDDTSRILTVSDDKIIFLKWDLASKSFNGIPENGLMEIWCHSLFKKADSGNDFGLIRICEITGGTENWKEDDVTFEGFCDSSSFDEVINPQMIIDVDIKCSSIEPNFIVIPSAVMERLFNGRTKGIVLMPLGAVDASFHSNKNPDTKYHPKLYFNLK